MSAPPKIPHRLAARRLMRGAVKAALATAMDDGRPYVSLVTVATAQDGSPLLLLSGLADHTRNLAADPRGSLLFDGTDGYDNPQQGPRVSVLGRLAPTAEPGHRARFLARHPEAAMYAGFGDFAFWRLEMERAHLVGGFARAVWLEDRLAVEAEPAARMAAAEESILAHMNAEHGAAIDLYARRLCGAEGDGWRMAGIDPDGCDLMRDGRRLRLDFDAPVDGPEAARAALVALATAVRSAE